MSIKYIHGNLFDSQCNIIAHGCNCKGGFGSGLAGQIAKKWPRVREAYLEHHNIFGWKLGDVQLVFCNDDFSFPIIANVATQEKYGYDGKLYADYEAIENGLFQVFEYAKNKKYSIALPRIGCGLAGGDWDVVKEIIGYTSSVFPTVAVEVYALPGEEL